MPLKLSVIAHVCVEVPQKNYEVPYWSRLSKRANTVNSCLLQQLFFFFLPLILKCRKVTLWYKLHHTGTQPVSIPTPA